MANQVEKAHPLSLTAICAMAIVAAIGQFALWLSREPWGKLPEPSLGKTSRKLREPSPDGKARPLNLGVICPMANRRHRWGQASAPWA